MGWLLLVIGVVAIVSLALWWPQHGDRDQRATLGSSLITGVVLSLTFFYLQTRTSRATRRSPTGRRCA